METILKGKNIKDRTREFKRKKRILKKGQIKKEIDEVRYLLEYIKEDDIEARFMFSYFAIEKIWGIQHDGRELADPTEKTLMKIEQSKRDGHITKRRIDLDREIRRDVKRIVKKRKEYKENVERKLSIARDIEMKEE